jgi:hypothetical protein
MTGLHHPLVQDYLARLDHAAAGLPPGTRAELLADLSAHMDSALGPASSDADVRNALQELGAPEDVAAAAYDGFAPPPPPQAAPTPGGPVWPAQPPSPWGPVEIIAVVGLIAGTFLAPVLGLIAGMVMAWVSDRWTRSEKVVATLLCLAPVLVLGIGLIGLVAVRGGSSSDIGGNPMSLLFAPVLLIGLLGPVIAGIYLVIRLSSRR